MDVKYMFTRIDAILQAKVDEKWIQASGNTRECHIGFHFMPYYHSLFSCRMWRQVLDSGGWIVLVRLTMAAFPGVKMDRIRVV